MLKFTTTKKMKSLYNTSSMKWAGSTKGALGVGLLTTIPTDESGVLLECHNFSYFPRFGQFTDMQCMVVRVGAKVIHVRQSIAHILILKV